MFSCSATLLLFHRPWTLGTGRSVALNMQGGPAREAEVMLSHSWSEDMEQVKDLLNSVAKNRGLEPSQVGTSQGFTKPGLVLSTGKEFSMDTVIWFCCFANFQVNDWKKTEDSDGYDKNGPTVAEQLKLEPFKKVIGSVKDMFLLHTT